MEDVCGFCKYGSDVEDVCGKLHVNKVDGNKKIAAHHKCMQYSAGLIQYKFDHFGGFKISKVEEELKRGRSLKCSICKNDRNRKGKERGATAGCAVTKCNKTFHFYCAKTSKTALTKRMLIKYKKENQEVVMYRVFCSHEHEEMFKKDKSLLDQRRRADDDSDLSDEDTDAEDGDIHKQDENEEEEEDASSSTANDRHSDIEDDFSLMSQPDSQPIVSLKTSAELELNSLKSDKENLVPDYGGGDITMRTIYSEDEEGASSTEDGFDESLISEASKTPTFVLPNEKGALSKTRQEEDDKTAEKSNSNSPKSKKGYPKGVSSVSDSESTPTVSSPLRKGSSKNISLSLRKDSTEDVSSPTKNVTNKSRGNVSAKIYVASDKTGSPKILKPRESPTPQRKDAATNGHVITTQAEVIPPSHSKTKGPEERRETSPPHGCALILTTSLTPSRDERKSLISKARQVLDIQEVAFWCDVLQCPGLTEKHLPCVVEKIGLKLSKKQHQEVTACLLGDEDTLQGMMKEVDILLEYFKHVDEDLLSQVHTAVQKKISSDCVLGENTSSTVYIMDVENSSLILKLTDDIDPGSEIRSKYHFSKQDDAILYVWKTETTLQTSQYTEEEGDTVVKWLLAETSGNFVLSEKPKKEDDTRLNDFDNACLCQLRNLSSKDQSASSTDFHKILWVAAVNPDIMKVLPYVKHSLSSFQKKSPRFYAVIDVGFYSDADFQVSLSELRETLSLTPCSVSIASWRNPDTRPVSMIVIKVSDTKDVKGSPRKLSKKRPAINPTVVLDDIITEAPVQHSPQGKRCSSPRISAGPPSKKHKH